MDANVNDSAFNPVFTTFQQFRDNRATNFVFRVFVATLQLWVSSLAVIWSAAFMYLMFYYSYIPLVSTTKEVHIQYDSTCNRALVDSVCRTPFAVIPLRQGRSGDFLRGQLYSFTLDIKMPESDVNWSQGMFMVRIRLQDQKRQMAVDVAKPIGLKYKSGPLRLITTLLYWPLFVLGLAEESQTISVNLIDDYIEGSHPKVGPISEAVISIEARDVQIYPPTVLRVSATLTGLRYFMYNYWLTSFGIGTSSIAFFLYILTLIGFSNYYLNNRNESNYQNNDHSNHRIDRELDEEIDEELNQEFNVDSNVELNDEQNCEIHAIEDETEIFESTLTGELLADESASEGSGESTLVIPEVEDFERQIEDMTQIGDSFIADS